jgi:prolyl 4-hydroxylase
MNRVLEFIEKNKYYIILAVMVILIISVTILYSSKSPKEIQDFQNIERKKYKEVVLSENPKIILLENFITQEEAEHLMKLADEIKRPSTIDTKDDPYTLVNNVRSSESAHLGKARDKIVLSIENKACDYVNLNTHYLEPMQVVVYEKGQKFNPHYDFFSADSQDLSIRGNRNKTILVYLNDIQEDFGGATVFPKLNLKIQPKAYSAIYFENMNGTEVDYNTLHAGEELKTDKIKKYAINIWFREKESW